MFWGIIACVVLTIIAFLCLGAMKVSGNISRQEEQHEWEMTFGKSKSSNSDLDSSKF